MKIEDVRKLIPDLGIRAHITWEKEGEEVRIEWIRAQREFKFCNAVVVPLGFIQTADKIILKNLLFDFLVAHKAVTAERYPVREIPPE